MFPFYPSKTMEYEGERYCLNDYLDGRCQRCLAWRAPTVQQELYTMPDPSAHIGTTPAVRDEKVKYRRETWHELFLCPKCQLKFAVPFSNM